jgi:hypothetical protein
MWARLPLPVLKFKAAELAAIKQRQQATQARESQLERRIPYQWPETEVKRREAYWAHEKDERNTLYKKIRQIGLTLGPVAEGEDGGLYNWLPF